MPKAAHYIDMQTEKEVDAISTEDMSYPVDGHGFQLNYRRDPYVHP